MWRYNPTPYRGNSNAGTLCDYCVNAVPSKKTGAGCNWSRQLQPVDGWNVVQGRGPNYVCVLECPSFVKEKYRPLTNPIERAAYNRLTWIEEE